MAELTGTWSCDDAKLTRNIDDGSSLLGLLLKGLLL